MTITIPFNKPCIVGAELVYVGQAIAGGHASGDGPFTRRVEKLMQTQFGAPRVLLTTSCTAAIEMAALLCEIEPGDEVILPSYTFVSTANGVMLRGATPVFVDIRPDTLNIDERLVEEAVTRRTKAIFVVHYAGVACEMDEIMAIARRHNLIVVEDAAQGVFAGYKDRWLGTIGHLGCYSFHETKNFSCGEGGALVVNDQRFEKRAEILRNKGTNRSQFLRGQVDKYTWVDVGSSYAPSDMLAAFLLGQLENMERITARRRAIYDRYAAALAPLAAENRIGVPFSPSHCATNHHMFYLLAADLEERTALIAHLRAAGILAVFHYVPLHSSPFARSTGLPQAELPVTDRVSSSLVRLPMYYDLADHEVDEIARCVMAFYDRRANRRAGAIACGRSFGRVGQRVKASGGEPGRRCRERFLRVYTNAPRPRNLVLPPVRSSVSYPASGNAECLAVEEGSFWFCHRNCCTVSLVRRYPPKGCFLDIGGGNGFVSKGLTAAAFACALLEPRIDGALAAHARGIDPVICARLDDAAIPAASFAAAGMFDVLEHIEDEGAVLKEVHRLLAPNGHLFLTVPAYQFLFSVDDVAAGHYRRYTISTLSRALDRSGFCAKFASYIFAPLPPIVFLLRTAPSKFGLRRGRDLERHAAEHAPGGVAARIMDRMLAAELKRIEAAQSLPFGGSCICVAGKVD